MRPSTSTGSPSAFRSNKMKQPWEWTEDDLHQLIVTPVRENITLDYKRCAALSRKPEKIKEISKDVSAFANSAGGTIVYGIAEDKNIPTEFDVGFDPAGEISKDWLDQIITSNIRPRIDGIRIRPVDIPKFQPGRLVLVVSIPQSKRAPHMANDNRYYKRYNFESVPMEDYEVRDVLRRLDAPDLEAMLTLTPSSAPVQVNPYWRRMLIQISIRNNSPAVATHVVAGLMIDAGLTIVVLGNFSAQASPMIEDLPVDGRFRSLIATHGDKPGDMPIWSKSIAINFSPIDVQVPLQTDADYHLVSFLSAPTMENKWRSHTLSVRSGAISLKTA